jgi:hypothetical protein
MTPARRARPVASEAAQQNASSRANGTRFGRPRKVSDNDHIATAKRMKADGHPFTGMAKKPDSVVTLSNRTVERLRSQAQIVFNTLSPLRVLDVLLRTSVEKG